MPRPNPPSIAPGWARRTSRPSGHQTTIPAELYEQLEFLSVAAMRDAPRDIPYHFYTQGASRMLLRVAVSVCHLGTPVSRLVINCFEGADKLVTREDIKRFASEFRSPALPSRRAGCRANPIKGLAASGWRTDGGDRDAIGCRGPPVRGASSFGARRGRAVVCPRAKKRRAPG